MSRKLTINVGLRVEPSGGVNEVNHLLSNVDLSCREPMGAAGSGPLGCFTIGKPAYNGSVNWAPASGIRLEPVRQQQDGIPRRIRHSLRFHLSQPDHQPALPAAVQQQRRACPAPRLSPTATPSTIWSTVPRRTVQQIAGVASARSIRRR